MSRNVVSACLVNSRMETPLEAAIRDHFRAQVEPMIGRSRHTTPEVASRLIEQKTREVLAVLRERLTDDAIPTEDDLHRASMEASHRTIDGLIPQMRDPRTQDPLRREILGALADDAERRLTKRRLVGPYPTEAQRAEMTAESVESFRALTERIKASRPTDVEGPPAPE